LTFEYIFSLFATHFYYSKSDFLELTLHEASILLNTHSEVLTATRLFEQSEKRLQSWFAVIAVAGSQKIREPKDLYLLPGEEKYTKQQKEFLTRPLTPEEREVLSKI
jgi:hypothetical protein